MATVPGARRREWITLALYALAFRVFSALLAFYANVVFPLYQPEQFTMSGKTSPFWDAFTRYDSGWYFDIARNGYRYVADGRGNIAFFPVYPLLMRYVGRAFGRRAGDLYLGGIVVSWVAFVLAMVVMFSLARLDLSRRRAERAVLLTAIFPFAFFYGVAYTEALFLFFTVASFYCFRTRRWVLGGVCGGLATATRANGILMLPSLAWIAWRSAEPTARDRALAIAGLVLVGCGVGAYSLYIYQLSGNPLEWAATISRWGYYPGGAPIAGLARLARSLLTHPYAYLAGERLAPYDTLNGLTALVFVAAVPLVWWRLGAAYGWFMAANLWLPLSSGQYEGMGRYCAVLFPFFIWLASLRSRAVLTTALVLSAMLYTLCLALFTTIHPLF
jgi:mannosyltransferase PIG-V